MGISTYNISEVTGAVGSGVEDVGTWTFTLDLADPGATTVSGDFNVVRYDDPSDDRGEAADGYSFSALNQPDFGTLSWDAETGEFTFTVDRAAVLATGSNQTVSFTVVGYDGYDDDDDQVVINILICVARGTLVETEAGPVPVEALELGGRVCTLDGPAVPIRWIGRRRLGPAELQEAPDLRPIRIGAGTLGDGLPRRDLLVSPQHRVWLRDWRAELLFGEPEVLVPAKSLLNDRDILVETTASEVEYFHLLFDRHELIFTEGAPTESFHPGPYAMREFDCATRDELIRLFPELALGTAAFDAVRPSLKPWEGQLLDCSFFADLNRAS
ncbi:Hint domain-containing protein [Rhodovulum adriaticum]|uniref:VCBS repeat-containing protein n=1 Tax=Rhodovulum adriaticum TaxID=35804 RepID=A0A4R2NNF5_RHOAD|nr:Hint domain-containing protein [Rhodovulum adriaticum]TCP23207.1 VCBS repeat-containing protein [Rhodovulum adriaticum]